LQIDSRKRGFVNQVLSVNEHKRDLTRGVSMSTREDWLKKRLNGIGASEAAAIVGASPYKTNIQLWEEKTGRRTPEDISDKPYVQFGIQAEEHLRALFALDYPVYKVSYESYKIIRNPDYPFIFATLDGELYDGFRKGILEIKTTEILRSNQWKEWDGRIPQNYYIQVCHQFLATGYDFAILKARIKYTKNGELCAAIRHYHIERKDVEGDIQYLLEKEIEFWDCVKNNKRPDLILPEI